MYAANIKKVYKTNIKAHINITLHLELTQKAKNKMKIKKERQKICLILNVFSDDKRQNENKSLWGFLKNFFFK